MVATWLAKSAVEEVRPLFAKANIPDFETPTEAIEGIMQIARYVRAQKELMQTPPVTPENHVDPAAVDAAIGRALAQGRTMMTEPEAKAVLSAYGIPPFRQRWPQRRKEAARAAEDLLRGCASVVVKILSPNLTHKSDIGGIRLDSRISGGGGESNTADAERDQSGSSRRAHRRRHRPAHDPPQGRV